MGPQSEVEAILSSISDGLIVVDNDWRFTHINAAAERIWRIGAADYLGRTIFDKLKVDGTNPFHPNYLEAKRTGEPVAFGAYSKHFDQWLEVRAYPNPGGLMVFFRDVSDERRVHRALIDSERKLAAAHRINQRIFETTLDLILVVDSKGNIIQVSPSVWTLLGYRPEEWIGRSARDFLYPTISTARATKCAWRGGATRCAISRRATCTRTARSCRSPGPASGPRPTGSTSSSAATCASATRPRNACAARSGSRPWASSPAALRTTSTTS